MKRALFLVVLSFCAFAAFCQDIIVMKNADEIKAIIVDIGISEVKYKKYSNRNGPTYTVLKSDIFMIKYANGEEETFLETTTRAHAVGNFTLDQRWGTWAINSAIPGLGSFIIMKDKVGGGIQLGTFIVGLGLVIAGGVVTADAYANPITEYTNTGYGMSIPSYVYDEDAIAAGSAMSIAGAVLWIGTEIFNIFRSFMYKPSVTKVASGFDPAGLQVTLIPGNHKIDKVSLSYTMRF
ncbi:hypothetical protein FACS1894172_17100 [Spirochaetia bacterium]|nr:hypothetical protein FACS1894164_21350 [Spirochaetia bacterium]GHU35364.1 hypothetical protein FACS1894172_17100 [Spirochaetia bacterium]